MVGLLTYHHRHELASDPETCHSVPYGSVPMSCESDARAHDVEHAELHSELGAVYSYSCTSAAATPEAVC